MEVLIEALQQGIAPAIVVAIYLIITKIIDTRKENIQLKLSTELTRSINKISSFIDSLTKDIVNKDKDKCKAAIEDAMYASGMRLCNFVSTTVINNNIEKNRENVLANIHNIVNAEFYSVYSTLSLYTIDGHKISEHLDKDWMEDVEKDLIDIIYNERLSKDDKIISFSNKINIKFQSYITYIINNM